MRIRPVFLLMSLLLAAACDPGHFGTLWIRNESPHALTLAYSTRLRDSSLTIPPGAQLEVFAFGGLGAGAEYSCVPCEFTSVALQPADPALRLRKAVADPGQWLIDNPNTWRFSSKPIRGEFVVTKADVE
ncbi:MAG: hypothetical protein NW241_14530 [Bacteroidia bacterium]|nr:hypothetical protein [Bacteroidia bacterium]